MANTGFNHAGLVFVPKADAADWDDFVITDSSTQFSDPISLNGKAGAIITFSVEGETGSVSENVTVKFLKEIKPGLYQDANDAYSIELLTEVASTNRFGISLSSLDYGNFLLEMQNFSGVDVTTSVLIDLIDVPAAS